MQHQGGVPGVRSAPRHRAQVCSRTPCHRDTVRKRPPHRPKLEPYTGVIDRILEDDLSAPIEAAPHSFQAHLRAWLKKEHGFDGGYTHSQGLLFGESAVVWCVRCSCRCRTHRATRSATSVRQWAFIGGKRRRIHYFVMSLPHSDGIFSKGISRGDHGGVLRRSRVVRIAFLGGVPQSILYDNYEVLPSANYYWAEDVARRTEMTFTELQSHYLFSDRFGRVGKGNDKGSVEWRWWSFTAEGTSWCRIPRAENFDALNAHLESECLERYECETKGAHREHWRAYGA